MKIIKRSGCASGKLNRSPLGLQAAACVGRLMWPATVSVKLAWDQNFATLAGFVRCELDVVVDFL